MTIDIGFAHMNDKISLIDVPGHEKFIRNMVAGVCSIDYALLVVAADDGIMPQTREHFEILKLSCFTGPPLYNIRRSTKNYQRPDPGPDIWKLIE